MGAEEGKKQKRLRLIKSVPMGGSLTHKKSLRWTYFAVACFAGGQMKCASPR